MKKFIDKHLWLIVIVSMMVVVACFFVITSIMQAGMFEHIKPSNQTPTTAKNIKHDDTIEAVRFYLPYFYSIQKSDTFGWGTFNERTLESDINTACEQIKGYDIFIKCVQKIIDDINKIQISEKNWNSPCATEVKDRITFYKQITPIYYKDMLARVMPHAAQLRIEMRNQNILEATSKLNFDPKDYQNTKYKFQPTDDDSFIILENGAVTPRCLRDRFDWVPPAGRKYGHSALYWQIGEWYSGHFHKINGEIVDKYPDTAHWDGKKWIEN